MISKRKNCNEVKVDEIMLGLSYIASGLSKLTESGLKPKEKSNAYTRVQCGALIINTQSHILYKSRLKSKKNWDLEDFKHFPTSVQEVVRLCEEPFSEWYEMFEVIKHFLPDFEFSDIQLLDFFNGDPALGAKEFINKKSEYEIREEFYESSGFNFIRELCSDDYEYCASRAYLPIIVPSNLDFISTRELFKVKSDDLYYQLMSNYYESFATLRGTIKKTDKGYGICECGYVMTLNSLNQLECAHAKCRQNTKRKETKPRAVRYVDDINLIIKPQYHRFITLPAIEELTLYSQLEELQDNGVITNLRLYPYKDAADISFEYKRTLYIIDVKEWTDPMSLVRKIKSDKTFLSNRFRDDIDRLGGKYKLFLVVPDYLNKELRGKGKYITRLSKINENVDKHSNNFINVTTCGKFIKDIKPKKTSKRRDVECEQVSLKIWMD